MIHLSGGPSHLDMYDMKPQAPAEYRGEFRPIATNVPGIEICELMPMQARVADKFAILRGAQVANLHTGNMFYSGLSVARVAASERAGRGAPPGGWFGGQPSSSWQQLYPAVCQHRESSRLGARPTTPGLNMSRCG